MKFVHNQYSISGTMKMIKKGIGCQEEDNDDLLDIIFRYNKDMHDEGVVVFNHPLIE